MDEKLDKIISLLEQLNQRMASAGYRTPAEIQEIGGRMQTLANGQANMQPCFDPRLRGFY